MAFCPKCKSEYRQGFTTCAECKLELVERLPQRGQEIPEGPCRVVDSSSLKFVSVFVSDDPKEVQAVRSILTENTISFITRGDEQPRFRYVDFLVREDRAAEAASLLKDIISKEADVDRDAPLSQELHRQEPPTAETQRLSHQKEPFNFLLVILMAIVAILFALKTAPVFKYFLAGGVMGAVIILILFKGNKRI